MGRPSEVLRRGSTSPRHDHIMLESARGMRQMSATGQGHVSAVLRPALKRPSRRFQRILRVGEGRASRERLWCRAVGSVEVAVRFIFCAAGKCLSRQCADHLNTGHPTNGRRLR